MFSSSFAYSPHYFTLHNFVLIEAYYMLSFWHKASAINSVLWQQQTLCMLDAHKTKDKIGFQTSLLLLKNLKNLFFSVKLGSTGNEL